MLLVLGIHRRFIPFPPFRIPRQRLRTHQSRRLDAQVQRVPLRKQLFLNLPPLPDSILCNPGVEFILLHRAPFLRRALKDDAFRFKKRLIDRAIFAQRIRARHRQSHPVRPRNPRVRRLRRRSSFHRRHRRRRFRFSRRRVTTRRRTVGWLEQLCLKNELSPCVLF